MLQFTTSIYFLFLYIFLLKKAHPLSCGQNHFKQSELKILEESDEIISNISESSFVKPRSKIRHLSTKEFTPIRIYIDYATLDSQVTVSEEFRNKIKQILELSKSSFESLLLVQRFKDKMKLLECGNSILIISDKVKNEGVEADLIIFPFIDTSYQGNVYEAYASPCILAGDTRRPVAGYIGFTKVLKLERENWLHYYTTLAMHELTHCLVFSPNLFPFFFNQRELYGISNIIKTVTINGKKRSLLSTPKVVQAAKVHFNCDSVEGVELENQGSDGTSGSHWEAREMLTDYMMGASYDEMSISEITLALFEDSGWYKVNYYTGGLFRFGKNEGCSFLYSKCLTNEKTNFPNEFCDTNYQPFCTNGRLSKGICYYTDYEKNITKEFQYFSNEKRGGLVLADYCPVSQVPSDKKMLFNWNCAMGKSTYPIDLGETVSESSICFISSLRLKKSLLSRSYSKKRAICHQYECDYNNKIVYVKINGNKYPCKLRNGQYVVSNILGYEGSLECPEFNNVCTNDIQCFDMIDCISKKSLPRMDSFDYYKTHWYN